MWKEKLWIKFEKKFYQTACGKTADFHILPVYKKVLRL